jgi:hypothetical protein
MISVSEKYPSKETTVFKRFDPKELSISFADDKIYLNKLYAEIETIKTNIPKAIKKMEDGIFHLWAT